MTPPLVLEGLDGIDHPGIEAIRQRCDIVQVTKEDDEPAWQKLRSGGLGGSEIGAALGLSPYTKPLKLWLVKTGQIPSDDLSEKEQVYWGNVLEDVVAAEFARRTGFTVIAPRATFIRKDRPTQIANPDFLYIDDDDELGVLEAKTGDWRTSEHWAEDSSPPWYEAQDGWYCDTLGVTRSRIAALLGGNRFVIRDPAFTPELLEAIGQAGLDWWQRHVVEGVEPDVDGSKATTDALNAMWERIEGQRAITDEDLVLVRKFNDAKARKKAAETDADLLGNQLRHLLADFSEAVYDTGAENPVTVFTNKLIHTTRIDWEAVATRLAAEAGHSDVLDVVTDEDRKEGSYRRLNLSRSKPAKALLAPPTLSLVGDPDGQ